jgi:hypothetical protein
MCDCPQYTSAVIIDDSVTKLAVLIDADNAQLSAINLVLLENMVHLMRSGSRSLEIFDILG